jgi:uncharacterized membrane protein YphA (DoxX/SURF4 family)
MNRALTGPDDTLDSTTLGRVLGSAPAQRVVRIALSLSLSAAFLSAVADRLGYWGKNGDEGVAWGNFTAFLDYAHLLLSPLPRSVSDVLGWIATGSEALLAIWLVLGVQSRLAGLCSAILLSTFATAMLFALGPKPVLDYSVFTAAAAALALATQRSEAAPDRPSHTVPGGQK